MSFKKVLCFILCVCLILSLFSCMKQGDLMTTTTTSGDEKLTTEKDDATSSATWTEGETEWTSPDGAPVPDSSTEPIVAEVVELPSGIKKNTVSLYGEYTKTEATYTGLEPLPKAEFKVHDPDNSRNLPTKLIAHAYGVAKDGKPNDISVRSQAFFDSKNYNAIAYDNKTDKKVLYLTFDVGYENGYTAKILDVLKEKNVPAMFFCTLPQIKQYPQLIARMILEGHVVGNHSKTHPSFAKISRTKMMEEVKAFDDYIREKFGYTAPFFRYPMGEYNESSLELLNSFGFKCVFWSVAYADWDLNNQKGKEHAFNTVTSRLHPGAVILLHSVSPDNANALGDIIDYARQQGYEFKLLPNKRQK